MSKLYFKGLICPLKFSPENLTMGIFFFFKKKVKLDSFFFLYGHIISIYNALFVSLSLGCGFFKSTNWFEKADFIIDDI